MSRYRRQSSNLLACFNPAAADADVEVVVAPPPPPPRPPTQPSLTTTLYRTDSGITFGLTWSRDNLFGRSLHIHVNHHPKPRFHLQIKPWNWTKRGSHPLPLSGGATAAVHWDLSGAKFGSGPAPTSGFYVAIAVNGTVAVLVGDRKHQEQKQEQPQSAMVLRREHVYGSRQMSYASKTEFGDINIDCRLDDADPRLYVSVDGKRVLQIKHLKWKFRGSERIHVAGLPAIQVSWDVHSWLFHPENPDSDGYALFIFKFHNQSSANHQYWNIQAQQQYSSSCGLGFETRKMSKRLKMLKSAAAGRRRNHSSAASSSSLSSASSGCSSVMEWESVEETELKDPAAFSLLVYAWKT